MAGSKKATRAAAPADDLAEALIDISRRLSRRVGKLRFGGKVAYVYNPLEYAREMCEAYLRAYARARGGVLLLGMNPGPWGMVQTGVPFGEVSIVRDWMKLDGRIGRPRPEHPKRPVTGLACHRSEVSGARLWGWARARFGTPARFFERFFVWNYCPLTFMVDSGANLTPDKLAAEERNALYEACTRALGEVIDALEPRLVVGIGKFAEERAREAVGARGIPVGCILHPSPASPKANGGWAEIAEEQLPVLGTL